MRAIDQLMTSIEEAAAARGRTAARPTVASSIEAVESPVPQARFAPDSATTSVASSRAAESLSQKAGQRHVDDFLGLTNEAFINEAYAYLLGRPPDERDLWLLQQFESGTSSKLKLLHLLVRSDEARSRNAPKIAGFELKYRLSADFWRNAVRYLLHLPLRATRLTSHIARRADRITQPQAPASAVEPPTRPEPDPALISKLGNLGVAVGQNTERAIEMQEQLRQLAQDVERLRNELQQARDANTGEKPSRPTGKTVA
jgi:hypothetical protein